MNLDEYKLINLPMEQNEHTGVGITPTFTNVLDTSRTLVKGVQQNCVWELTLARGVLCLPPLPPPPIERLLVLGYKNGSPKAASTR